MAGEKDGAAAGAPGAAPEEPSTAAPYGLVGHPLGHSWSPTIHELLGSAPYALLELELDALPRELEPCGATRLKPVHHIVDILRFHTHASSFGQAGPLPRRHRPGTSGHKAPSVISRYASFCSM